jgi:site-specific recombinase XerD
LKREIPEGWEVLLVGDILDKVQNTPRLATNEYMTTGQYPIIDQTANIYYAGFTDREDAVSRQFPAVVFGDHSCAVKYVNFPFVRGADGTQIMLSKDDRISIEYLYFATKNIPLREGYARHYSILKESYIIAPTIYIAKLYQKLAVKQFELITSNRKEIIELSKQRDELLPLLMNGQVSVNYHLSKSCMRQFVYSYYHSLKNTMKQKFIHSVLQELSKVLDSQQLDFVENTLEHKLHDLDIIEQVTNEELVNQENDELLTAFLSAKKIEGCSAKTIKYYKSTINHLFDEIGKTTAEITANDIRSYLAYYQEQKKSSKVTIDNMRRIFSSFFSWLEDEDYIVKSPVRRIHKVRTDTLVKEVINDECMELLRDNCTEIRDLAMIDLLASTGMRVGELVQMNIDDVDFQERQCKVFGKGNKEREVYFNARAKIHLQQYISQREDDNPALFVSFSSPHKRLSISGVEVRLRTLGRRINLPKIHPHKFRRTLATMAIDKGMPIEQVQRLLGHVKIDTTLHYAMVNQNNVKLAHRRYIG